MRLSFEYEGKIYTAGFVREGNYATLSLFSKVIGPLKNLTINIDGSDWRAISTDQSSYVKGMLNIKLEKIIG